MKVNYLSNKIPWFGKFSGYEILPNYFKDDIQISIVTVNNRFINKFIGKLYQIYNKWYFISPAEISAEMRFLNKIKKNDISHILYFDQHVHLLDNFKKNIKSLIGTIHLPIDTWSEDKLLLLTKIDNVIILYKEETERFSKYIPLNKIHVIKLGVDINFFKPDKFKLVKKNKVLFIGHYLRNFEMFYKVYELISKNLTDSIEYHFIIPESFRNIPVLKKIKDNQNVYFHQNLSDEKLLEQYQDSYALLMPMENSGANTAIIQAIAVGLPVITTDVGGIRSYGGGDIFPIVANNDHEGMARLFEKYYNDVSFRDDISNKQRQFALEKLDWKIIINEHLQLYKSIT